MGQEWETLLPHGEDDLRTGAFEMSQQQPAWQEWMEANAPLYLNEEYPVTALAVDASVKFGGAIGHDEYEAYVDRLYFNRANKMFDQLGLPKNGNTENGY